MEIQLIDPSEVPLPPEEVRIRNVNVQPYPDGRRMRLNITLTPYQLAPDVEILARNPQGEEVARVNIIGTASNPMSLTMHLRGPLSAGTHQLEFVLSYEEQGEVDRQTVDVDVEPPGPGRS